MKFCYRLFLALCVLTSPASAKSFYAGIALGLNDQDGKFKVNDQTIDPLNFNIDKVQDYKMPEESELNYSVFVGYKLGRDLMLEIGLSRNDDAIIDGERLSANNDLVTEGSDVDFSYAAFVGLWPLDDQMAINARFGFTSWDLEYGQLQITSDDVFLQVFRDNASGMFVGVGLSYGLDPDLELKFNIERHTVDFTFTNLDVEYDATILTVGVAYHF